ncbi:MAG TPA: hypothetical protein VFY63_04850 [Pseudorhizobium sp.]|nr:hypothetical protein [Pseudorhizobium sp.]
MPIPDYKKSYYARHYEDPPQVTEAEGAKTWLTRGASFVISVTKAAAGTVLVRHDNPDEYMVILPVGVGAVLSAGAQTVEIANGDTLAIMPPGASVVRLLSSGEILRIFSNKAEDLAKASVNSSFYETKVEGILPVVNWPDPEGGFKIRTYDLVKYLDPKGPLIQPRIFRSTNLMINAFAPWHTLRETSKLGPHYHDDFEQASVTLKGRFVHHIRYPWTSDLGDWFPDEHTEVASPSVAIIPPPLLHTTRNASADGAILVDVFAPPRVDFSLKPGFVLNANDYPVPNSIRDGETALLSNVSAWGS